MGGSTVAFIAFFTAAVTAAGTVYVIERYKLLPANPPTAGAEAVVPELAGISESDARANAQAAHVALLVASREPSESAKPGTVVRQSIAPGQRVPRDHPVSVVLAEEVPRVPNVSGITVAEATQKLEQQGYHLQVGATTAHATVAQGLVFDQSPKAAAAQAKGTTITVSVSAGPADVELPKLLGVAIPQATADLEKLGVKPVVTWVAMAETPTFIVLSQKPPAGAKVKPGSEVHLTACRP